MAEPMDPARRAAFLTALAETGNQTLAAERARVSRSWVVLRRRTDPGFRAELDAAVAAARARLAEANGTRPESRWRDGAGQELIVRGGNGRFLQVARAKLDSFTPRLEQRFLTALKGSCNVLAACRATGLKPATVYAHRKRWPAFADAWDAAIEEGYDRLSAALVASAGAMLGDTDMEPDASLSVTSVAEALQVLSLYKSRKEGRSFGKRPRPRTLDEVRGSILQKLDALAGAARHERREKAAALKRDRAAGAALPRPRLRRRWRAGDEGDGA
mgnify:CR=1 FL=1